MLPIVIFVINFSFIVISFCGLLLFFGILRKNERIIAHQSENKEKCLITPYKVAVMMSLRGADPDIRRTFEGLLQQDYPDYHVFIIVDHEEDSALPIVRDILGELDPENKKFTVWIREEFYETASPESAAIIQCYRDIPEEYEIIAQCDGDVVPYPSWLDELVLPLQDKDIVATSGYRWHPPLNFTLAENVRYLFNATSLVWIVLGNYVWGGSFAIRRSAINETGISDGLKSAMAKDSLISGCLSKNHKSTLFVPTVLIENAGTCSFSSVFQWLLRQLLWNYVSLRKKWFGFFAMIWGMILMQFFVFSACVYSAIVADKLALFWYLGSALVFWGGNIMMLMLLEAVAKRQVQNHRRKRGFGVCGWIKLGCTIPLAYAVTGGAILAPLLRGAFNWRGVKYQIKKGRISIIEYNPYK